MTFDDFRACIDARISSAYGLDEADLYLITEELQKLDIWGVRELIRDDPFAATCLLNDLADFFVITSRSFTASPDNVFASEMRVETGAMEYAIAIQIYRLLRDERE
jgi:hypothetical protein